jgi:hypothetical protein
VREKERERERRRLLKSFVPLTYSGCLDFFSGARIEELEFNFCVSR